VATKRKTVCDMLWMYVIQQSSVKTIYIYTQKKYGSIRQTGQIKEKKQADNINNI
jgi:hypothetical protein